MQVLLKRIYFISFHAKRYGFLSFARKHKKETLDTGLDASKKVVHKASEFRGNKISDEVLSKTLSKRTKSNDDIIEKQEHDIKEIIIPPEKREKKLNNIRKVL